MSDETDDLDPRIQVELERLNNTTDEINKLEIEYDEAKATFPVLLNEATRRLMALSRKLGGCIDRSRPYYELLEKAKRAQEECKEAAALYKKAHGVHLAAKETVALAEQRFLTNQHQWQFDNAWQEMLNHATMKVMEAEHEKTERGREHQRRASASRDLEERLKQLEDQHPRSIAKSRPYFDEKRLCDEQLSAQKRRIESLRSEIVRAKSSYAETLKRLEQISNEIHSRRVGVREPGVGAELVEPHEASKSFVEVPLDKYRSVLDECDRPVEGECEPMFVTEFTDVT